MDPWINSLVQSPLVRSLNTVPSRMSSFAYGVRDNVPPFSFAKEVVDRKSGEALGWTHQDSGSFTFATAPQTTFDFEIPESGLLDRMYLRVRMYSKGGTRVPLMPVTDSATLAVKRDRDALSNSMNFGSILESVALRTTGSRTIQTLYPAAIAAEVQKMPSAQREFWYQCLNGFAAGVANTGVANVVLAPFSQLYNPYAEVTAAIANPGAEIAALNSQNAWADFLIPLPFSVMDQLKDNFQTRFVDDLTLSVKLVDDPALTQGSNNDTFAGFKCSLVCVYHNFHDVIENSIRDQNFKRGFPASVYSHNYIQESNPLVSGKQLTFRIGAANLISEMYCLLKSRSGTNAAVRRHTTAAPPRDGTIGPFKFTLYGSGRQLWEAYSWELCGPDVADYQLADAHAYGEDLARPILARRVANASIRTIAPDAANIHLDVVSLGFDQLFCLRFGFQAHDNFYTGGLALQTISNPTLVVESLGSEPLPWAAPQAAEVKYSMEIVMKSCQMLRIDSDTGVITTSLDV